MGCRLQGSWRKRRLKTFATRKEADDFAATTHIDLKNGIHIPDRDSVTVAQAGICGSTNEEDELERLLDQAQPATPRQPHRPAHRRKRLNQLNVPEVRAFIDRLRSEGVSKALAKMLVTSLGSIIADAQERGLASHNPVRDMRKNRGKRARRPMGARSPLRWAWISRGHRDPQHPSKATGRRRALVAVLAFAGLRPARCAGCAGRISTSSATR